MEEYEGPVVISMPRRGAGRVKTQADQFSRLPMSITDPMDGFSHATTTVDLFDVPRSTSAYIDNLPLLVAVHIPKPNVLTTLKLSRLDAGLYTVADIKEVLYLHGVTVPKDAKLKKDYDRLARASGVVSRL